MTTRRLFLFSAAGTGLTAQTSATHDKSTTPWYRRTLRWGQTNITEKDPERYDIAFWQAHWKRTRTQGVIINAGGIVAYYPSKFPLHRRAEFLGERDLYGELAEAAHTDGLTVLARMDSNRAGEDFYKAHPDWFTLNGSGDPYRAADKYITCINSAYYSEYIPSILKEIIERSHCEGLTDNSWSGLGRESICYCDNCARSFRSKAGSALPASHNWDDPTYRQWIEWNYARRLEIWDLNNRATKAAGGEHCLWVGMNSGSISGQSRSFRDFREICRRAEIIMLDHQRRDDVSGFQENAACGKLIHGILGWEKVIPESMAMYQAGRNSFRLAAKPAAEARLWMEAGFAGGIQPWWHHVGAFHEDKRAYRTAEPVMRWHEANQQYLHNRLPLASVGMVWTQRNTDYFGRDRAGELVDEPWRGFANALTRARIPFLPVHADDIARDSEGLAVLVLPNVAVLSDAQCEAIRSFVARGGSIVATGATSACDESGTARRDFALADLFGVHAPQGFPWRNWASANQHTYLRLSGGGGSRHEVLKGFDETSILAFGGMLEKLRTEESGGVVLTFIPGFPVYPPETSWMRQPNTDIPALVVRGTERGGRVAYVAADVDRRYARDLLPDHATLLANTVRWAAKGRLNLTVEGPGFVDCHLYRQQNRLILHVVNLTNTNAWRAPVDELTPAGPLKVRVRLPRGIRGVSARLLVRGTAAPVTVSKGWLAFTVPVIRDHEVVVAG